MHRQQIAPTGDAMRNIPLLLLLLCSLSGCVATAVGAVADVAIEVAKVPFKVGGAVMDGVSGDDEGTE